MRPVFRGKWHVFRGKWRHFRGKIGIPPIPTHSPRPGNRGIFPPFPQLLGEWPHLAPRWCWAVGAVVGGVVLPSSARACARIVGSILCRLAAVRLQSAILILIVAMPLSLIRAKSSVDSSGSTARSGAQLRLVHSSFSRACSAAAARRRQRIMWPPRARAARGVTWPPARSAAVATAKYCAVDPGLRNQGHPFSVRDDVRKPWLRDASRTDLLRELP